MDLRLLDAVSWRGSPVPGERTHALLAALAVSAGEAVGEERLVDEIWGDDVPANPVKALQVVVSRARAATAAAAVLRTPHGYRLGVGTDLDHARERAASARGAEVAGDWPAAEAAAGAIADVVVAAEGDGELGRARALGRAAVAEARSVRGRALSALGRHAEALPLLADDDDEASLLARLRSEAAVRGVPAALERYELIRHEYADRLGVDPGPALQALHAELLARDRPVREGVRYDASRLIGRDADVAALVAMTRSSRLVSILGPGGLGKTRLAHLLGRLAEQPTVHVVELVGVVSDDGVVAEVADALGVRDSVAARGREAVRRADLVERLVDRLGSAPSLLVLDNCEHVVNGVADLVALLLARTPALTVLTTTRSPLGLAAERVYPLPQLGSADAEELFRERATAARPGVRLNAAEVRDLVDRLDGLPLAVELAAARVRVLSVAEIGRRLEDRFALLRGGSRDAPERHQTLLAVIDWSWNLLADAERSTLRRLSVFRDGFTGEAAAAVVDDHDAFERVARLVDQSLVSVQETAEGLRYRLLETVREFGRARLAEAGETDDTDARLRSWACGLAAGAARGLFGPDQVRRMTDVRGEEGNLAAVLRSAIADRDVATVVPVAAALLGFWSIEGSHVKVVAVSETLEDVLEDVLEDAEVDRSLEPALRGVLAALVVNTMIYGNRTTDRGLAHLRALGPGSDPQLAGLVRVLLAGLGADVDHDALEALVDDPDPYVARVALQWSCQVLESGGLLAEARARGESALALWTPDDGPWGRSLTTVQLASVALSLGDVAGAERRAREALPLLEVLGAEDDAVQVRGIFALGALRSGALDEAGRLIEEMALSEGGRSVVGGALTVLCGRAEVALARGDVVRGLAVYRTGIEELEGRHLPGSVVPMGLGPWTLYPVAAAVSAHARAGALLDGAALRDLLLVRTREAFEDLSSFPDYPVLGTSVFALGLWELHAPGTTRAATAVALLAGADRFAYHRMLPSLEWPPARERAEEVLPGALDVARASLSGGRPADHRDAVLRALDALG